MAITKVQNDRLVVLQMKLTVGNTDDTLDVRSCLLPDQVMPSFPIPVTHSLISAEIIRPQTEALYIQNFY